MGTTRTPVTQAHITHGTELTFDLTLAKSTFSTGMPLNSEICGMCVCVCVCVCVWTHKSLRTQGTDLQLEVGGACVGEDHLSCGIH